jgi:hypothetical protein
MIDEKISQFLGRLGGKKSRMGKSELADLILNGSNNLRITMTQARHRCTAGAIKIAFAGGIDQITALTSHSHWR